MRELSIDQLKSRIRSTVMLVLVAVICISASWIVSDRAGAIRAAEMVAAARSQPLAQKGDVALVLPDRDDVLPRWERKALVVSALVAALCLVILALTRLLLIHLDRLKLARHTVSDQQRELRFKAAQIDAALDVILQIDLEGRLVHFNQALCRMTGYRPEELAGLRLHDIEPPEFADQVLENLRLIKERQQATFESAYLGKAGKVIPVEVHARYMECEGRQLVLSIARDVTRRKQAESRERSRRMLLERIATGAPVDELLVEIVRFVEEEIPGALCSVLLADETGSRLRHGAAPSLPDAYNEAVDGIAVARGIGSCGTAAFLRQRVVVEEIEGHPYWQGFHPARSAGLRACWSEPVLSSEGELLGTLAIYMREPCSPQEGELELMLMAAHLTSIAIERVRGEESRRGLEEQLRQSQRMEAVGQLAAGVAHDFNNLLTPIYVCAETVRNGFDDSHPHVKQIEAVMLAARKASDLTRKLLSFGRKQLLCMEVLDLNEVITSFTDILRTTLRESISLELRLAPGEARVCADRGQLEQILLNLAVNAQDAMSGTGNIGVETGMLVLDEEYARVHAGVKPGRYALLTFRDDGCGMDEETLRRIYEPFFTTKEAGRGTGLGLASVYGLVKQHDGYIEVWSRPGAGTVFKIYLPLSPAAVKRPSLPASVPAAAQAAGTGKTILFVEDNSMIREMAGELLAAHGYLPLVASDPLDALNLAAGREGEIDLLVTDVVLPEMNGPELYGRLLESRPRLPVLYVSGYTGNVVVHKNSLEMETNFLSKPFTLGEFLDRIGRMLSP